MTLDLETIKTRLEAKRAELLASMNDIRAEFAPFAPDGEGDVQEREDAAADISAQEQEGSALAADRALLTEVQQALERMAARTYGRCTVCGKPIAEKRLEALPWAPLCITDQQRLEQRQSSFA